MGPCAIFAHQADQLLTWLHAMVFEAFPVWLRAHELRRRLLETTDLLNR